jgi:hypothetical protein
VHLLDVLTEVLVMGVPVMEIVVGMVAVGGMEVAMAADIVTVQEAMVIEMAAMVAEATVVEAATKGVAVVVVAAMSAMPSRRAAADLAPTVAIATMLPLLVAPVLVVTRVVAGTMAEAQDTQDPATLQVHWLASDHYFHPNQVIT